MEVTDIYMWQSRVENEHYSVLVKIDFFTDIESSRHPPLTSQVRTRSDAAIPRYARANVTTSGH